MNPLWTPGFLAALALIGFVVGAIGLGFAIWNRGERAGRMVSVIEQSAKTQEVTSEAIQQQTVALHEYSSGMQALGQGLTDIAGNMRQFTQEQQQHNREMWNAIAVVSDQNKRAMERDRAGLRGEKQR